jgi:hypothetical protein
VDVDEVRQLEERTLGVLDPFALRARVDAAEQAQASITTSTGASLHDWFS